jgi:hypothetical protein
MPLEGKLSYGELADLLQVIDISRKNGILNVRSRKGVGRLFFEMGKLVRAESNLFSVRVGDVLVEQGILSRDSLQAALGVQRSEGNRRKLGAIICEDMGVTPEEVEAALTVHFKAVIFDILSWPEGRIRFDVSDSPLSQERFSLNAAEFILAVGIEAGYLVIESSL